MGPDLIAKLKEKLNSKKDECKLYGDLRDFSKIKRLKAKNQIDNIMFRFQLQQDEESNLPPNHQTQNPCANKFVRSPPPTSTPVEASSPVYNLQHQSADLALPDISSFQNLQPKGNQQYSYRNRTYLNMLDNNAPQDPIMNGDLE